MSDTETGGVPPEIAAQLARALDRSPATVTSLIGPDLKTRWLSESATWVMGIDPETRMGRESLELVHPDDVGRLLHAFALLNEVRSTSSAAVPVIEPIRYRVGSPEQGWNTREALVHNLLDDPEVNGLLLIVRPVSGTLDGVGHVIDLLVADARLPVVLAACAALVPAYLGSATVVGLVDGEQVIGVPVDSPAKPLSHDDRWWRATICDGKPRAPIGFSGFPDDLADQAREAGFQSAWVMPLLEASTGEVTGCVVVWVLVDIEYNIGTDQGLLQTQRLASLVIGEQRREQALRRQAVTDPLTGVSNRSALRRRLDAAIGPVTAAFLDLDDFKAVNDTYGHDAGDTVLREVAQRLGESVREDDLVVRLGGDEFAVVFSEGTPPPGIDQLRRRILDTVNAPIEIGPGVRINVHASMGVATGPPTEVVHRADDALYASKRAKRSNPG